MRKSDVYSREPVETSRAISAVRSLAALGRVWESLSTQGSAALRYLEKPGVGPRERVRWLAEAGALFGGERVW